MTNLEKHQKYNEKHKYRLNSYSNYNEHKGYYVLTKGKYKIEYATISFRAMYKYIKEKGYPFTTIHLNNMTLDDLFDYCTFEENENGKI